MKKKILILFIMLFMLVGCGKKEEMVCTIDGTNLLEDSDKISLIEDFTFTYKKDKLNKLRLDLSFTFDNDSYNKDDMQAVAESIKSTYDEQYGDYKNIKVFLANKNNNTYVVSIVFNYNKLTNDEIEELNLEVEETIEENRDIFENNGYECS